MTLILQNKYGKPYKKKRKVTEKESEETNYEELFIKILNKTKREQKNNKNEAFFEALILTVYKIFEQKNYLNHEHGWFKKLLKKL